MRPFALALALAALASPAMAACPGNTQREMNACAAAEAQRADRALSATYAKLERTQALIAAQRAWITFRDGQCRYESGVHAGGTIQPLVLSSCIARVTKARTAELDQLAGAQPYARRRR